MQLRAVPDQHRINTEHCDILDGFLRSLVKLLRRTWPVFLTWILARRASFCHWRGSKMMVIMDDSAESFENPSPPGFQVHPKDREPEDIAPGLL